VFYSYAVIRVVPRVEREEFLNVGVIVFAREENFLQARIELDAERVKALSPQMDLDALERHLATLQAIAAGNPEGGPVAALPAAERFYWLVSPRSTVIQVSPVHPGRSNNPQRALDDLMASLVRRPRPNPSD
jgi:hypothetical protein